MNKREILLKNEKGAIILAITFMIMFAIFLYGATTLAHVILGQRALKKEVGAKKALYFAEAGITRAIWNLVQDDDWSDESTNFYTNEPISEGTYSVTLSSRTINTLMIESTGVIEGIHRTVRVKVKRG